VSKIYQKIHSTPSIHDRISVLQPLFIIGILFLHADNSVVHTQSHDFVTSSWSSLVETFFSMNICKVASIMFMYIAGYRLFLNFEPCLTYYRKLVSRRAKRILIPYLFWSFFWLIIFGVLSKTPVVNSFFARTHEEFFTLKQFVVS